MGWRSHPPTIVTDRQSILVTAQAFIGSSHTIAHSPTPQGPREQHGQTVWLPVVLIQTHFRQTCEATRKGGISSRSTANQFVIVMLLHNVSEFKHEDGALHGSIPEVSDLQQRPRRRPGGCPCDHVGIADRESDKCRPRPSCRDSDSTVCLAH